MLKKIMTVMMVLMMVVGLTGCSKDDSSSSSSKVSPSDDGIKIKTVDDFEESNGLISYFTIDDHKIAIPETVGEYVNYLKQIGTVTLNSIGQDPSEVDLPKEGISSMVAYLNVELDNGDVAHMYLRYKNPTKKTIKVSEASVTFLEVKYDPLSENEFDKTLKNVEVVTKNGTVPLDGKMAYTKVRRLVGEPEQETDGRFIYNDDAGYKNMLDCCNENRSGIFRGFSIEYPNK